MTKINAIVVADSLSPQGHRLTSMLVTFPRIILSEFNTHRVFSRNSASSRAIPTKRLIKMIKENPFIPLAWQKEHTGMQGNEYFDINEKFNIHQLSDIIILRLRKLFELEDNKIDNEFLLDCYTEICNGFPSGFYTLTQFWLMIRDKVVVSVMLLYALGITKQIVNRLLEPFMWTTVLVTASEWENFFNLRCPQYVHRYFPNEVFRSWKDLMKRMGDEGSIQKDMGYFSTEADLTEFDVVERLQCNKGQAEIHMMALAEAMWDAKNESKPIQLQAGEWHIPFKDKINENKVSSIFLGPNISGNESRRSIRVKISTAMAARTSYTVVGDEKEITYDKLISIYEKMKVQVPFHASPFEHCSMAMSDDEYNTFYNGDKANVSHLGNKDYWGWCRNFRGFKQLRYLIEEGII